MFNNQRDGHMRQEINVGRVSYHPNSLGGGCPFQAKIDEGGFNSFNERIDAQKVRDRSESFSDHFSQATLFFNSQTQVEKNHIINALRFELGKLETLTIQIRMLGLLSQIDKTLADKVAQGLGLKVPTTPEKPMNHGVGADADKQKYEPKKVTQSVKSSDALSMLKNKTLSKTIATRQVAFLCSEGVDRAAVNDMKAALEKEGASIKIIAPHLGTIKTSDGSEIKVDQSFLIASSVLFDAVYIPGGKNTKFLNSNASVIEFINEAYKHCKVIGADESEIFINTNVSETLDAEKGIILNVDNKDKAFRTSFIDAMGEHRFWNREEAL
jgi:catalase